MKKAKKGGARPGAGRKPKKGLRKHQIKVLQFLSGRSEMDMASARMISEGIGITIHPVSDALHGGKPGRSHECYGYPGLLELGLVAADIPENITNTKAVYFITEEGRRALRSATRSPV